eukprot:NODE_4108_length_709_cov_268.278287.p2 GENE.NODE_4108_length_709_cov_268.278287~~NODE_4108_length_709_cov_268.278287.p2  ORF type:complete len:141 (-),score=30.62 NODE_4108_length_709_cov_268.278287:269-691(-)
MGEALTARRFLPGAHLVLELTSLTLKARGVVAALEAAHAAGVSARIVSEREIAYKAWYAGRGGMGHLLASAAERSTRVRIGGCQYFVGMTEPGNSREPGEGRRDFGYHWHVAYVLDLHYPQPPQDRSQRRAGQGAAAAEA